MRLDGDLRPFRRATESRWIGPVTTRRTVMRTALAVPLAIAAGWVVRARGGIAAARPRASGTSATRCGACGGRGHGMLSRRCPARPRVIE